MDERDLELGYLRYVVRFLWPIGVIAFLSMFFLLMFEPDKEYEALVSGLISTVMLYAWPDIGRKK